MLTASMRVSSQTDDATPPERQLSDFDRALNECMSAGNLRGKCIEAMPENLQNELRQREAAQRLMRQNQMRQRWEMSPGHTFGLENNPDEQTPAN